MAAGTEDTKPQSTEPLFAQVPTSELKQILSDRFAREVSAAAWQRISRALTFFGVPGILAVGGVIWKVLDTESANRIASQRTEVIAEANRSVDSHVAAMREVLESRVNERVLTAFTGEYGRAVQGQLTSALAEPRIQESLRAAVQNAVLATWAQEKEPLRQSFLQQVTADRSFLDSFAQQVAAAMAEGRLIPNIIGEALDTAIRKARPEDTGRMSALALLAAVDQMRANATVRFLLDEGNRLGQRDMALQSLLHVSFVGLTMPAGEATAMLQAALRTWSAHCVSQRCGPEQDAAKALAGFLVRGRDLGGAERDAWVLILQLWHEELLRGEARMRTASLQFVPQALGTIATPYARTVLGRWFTADEPDQAMSAALAVAGLPRASLGDDERLALFRTLWPKLAAEARPAVVVEAGWMALGRLSDGRPDAFGAFRPEAQAVRAQRGTVPAASQLMQWATSRQREPGFSRAAPPAAEPCAVGAAATMRFRPELCGLTALIRPEQGIAEWTALRRAIGWSEPDVAVLGLIWALAASRNAEDAEGAEARLAPLPDLLRMREPIPPAWRLAAMLMLRTAPGATTWQMLRELQPKPLDAPFYVAASRWLFRPWAPSQIVFVEELGRLPPEVGTTVLRGLLAAAIPNSEVPDGDTLPALARHLSADSIAGLNALHLAYAIDPEATLAAVEREGAFRAIGEAAAGSASARGVRSDMAAGLMTALLERAGWSRAAATPTGTLATEPFTALAASLEGRFGRLALPGGAVVTLDAEEVGKSGIGAPPVAFYNPTSQHSRWLSPGQNWRVSGSPTEEWLFRLAPAMPAAQLRVVMPQTLVPAVSRTATPIPTLEFGRAYSVASLPPDPGRRTGSQDTAGWVQLAGLRAGERLRIETFDLDLDVDTTLALHRGTDDLPEDDDGGAGLASRLLWTVDLDGEVLLRLANIRAPGAFRIIVERVTQREE